MVLPVQGHRAAREEPLTVDFYVGTQLEVFEIDSLVSHLEKDAFDLKAMHKMKRAVNVKLCAEEIASRGRQLAIMAAHLAEVAAKNVNRNPRTNQE